MSEARSSSAPLPVVAVVGWLIPGGGYFIIGERARGVTSGVAIVALFLAGILVGGIRVMDPPGWGQFGYMTQLQQGVDQRGRPLEEYTRVEPSSAAESRDPVVDDGTPSAGTALFRQPGSELADKPWYVGQILCGPITFVASAVSVAAAHPIAGSAPPAETWPSSHSRSWEIGALYTAVAGMLNLLVIIDSVHRRASQGKQ
jgi:hypothetical protein